MNQPNSHINSYRLATSSNSERIFQLATYIWHQHYDDIIGPDQVDYMLNTVHSAQRIAKDMEDGLRYNLFIHAGQDAGYAAAKIDQGCFISKLYVKNRFRGKGLASGWLNDLHQDLPAERQWLTVNKFNTASIEFYQRQGFHIVDSQVTDIGNGYVMDDFIMERPTTI